MSRAGEILGPPGYMPEQASGVVTNIGPAVDVYALGLVLDECLTGRPPFQAPDPIQTLMMVFTREPVPPRALQPDVPRDLETICLKCLEKAPKKRYKSARELADDLRRFLDGRPIVAPGRRHPLHAPGRLSTSGRRRRIASKSFWPHPSWTRQLSPVPVSTLNRSSPSESFAMTSRTIAGRATSKLGPRPA